MRKLLVSIDRNLESSYALRTACLLGDSVSIETIHSVDPPDRDMSFGAGWARVSWEREAGRLSRISIEGVISAEKNQHPNIKSPVILAGDPIQESAHYYWAGAYDLLVFGAPYRGLHPLALVKKCSYIARKENKEIALLIVHNLRQIRHIVALTDGSEMAEKALGKLVQIGSMISPEITLIGLPAGDSPSVNTDGTTLERGMAILTEKGFSPSGYTSSELGPEGLCKQLDVSDMAVSPFLTDAKRYKNLIDYFENDFQSVLFYLGRESG